MHLKLILDRRLYCLNTDLQLDCESLFSNLTLSIYFMVLVGYFPFLLLFRRWPEYTNKLTNVVKSAQPSDFIHLSRKFQVTLILSLKLHISVSKDLILESKGIQVSFLQIIWTSAVFQVRKNVVI